MGTQAVSPLFRFPTGDNTYFESYLSKDVTWPRFISVSSENMRLRDGWVPELAWKFSKGSGSRDWTILADEGAYHRMMEAAAKRIRANAKRAREEPDLGSGWWIDLKVMNDVQRVEAENNEDGTVSTKGKEKERKKKPKRKSPKKRKRGGNKKVFFAWQLGIPP